MRPRKNGQKGAALVEAALTIGVFMLTFILTMDLLRLSFRTVTAQFIVDRALADLVRGTAINPGPPPTGGTAYPNVNGVSLDAIGVVCQRAARFGADLSCGTAAAPQTSDKIRICSGVNLTPADCDWSSASPGRGRDYILVGIKWPFRFTFWGGDYDVTADTIGRNEPFRDA